MNLFGTDGIRGIFEEDLTCDVAYRLGQAVASEMPSEKRICVGKDTRISGTMLERSLIEGMISVGKDVVRLGVITTPGLSFIVNRFGLGAGVMISASHNSFEYNGLKVFGGDGRKIPEEVELLFSERILNKSSGRGGLSSKGRGRVIDGDFLVQDYVEFLASLPKPDMSHFRVLLDAANGSATPFVSKVWETTGAHVRFIHCEPNGVNINKGCGSTDTARLAEEVVRGRYQAGFAYDGDGDRCIAVDETGSLLNGDHIMAIMASDMVQRRRLAKNTVVGTVMANYGLEQYLSSHGIAFVRTPVGDRFVLEEMDRGGYTLGGEQSGHIIFGELLPAGDGMLTSLLFSGVVTKLGSSLSKLASVVKQSPQVLVNVRSRCPGKIVDLPIVQQAIMRAGQELDGFGRVLVRASGTEPVIRIMVESDNKALVHECVTFLKSIITREAQTL